MNTMMLGENGEECLDHTYETFIAQVAALRQKEKQYKVFCSLKTSTAGEVSVGDLGSGKPAPSLDGTRWQKQQALNECLVHFVVTPLITNN